MGQAARDLNLTVLHDNGSRQAGLKAGMEVLIETKLPKKVTLVLRATVRAVEDTPPRHEEKGRFTLALGDLFGFHTPSAAVEERVSGDVQECCYADAKALPAHEMVAWLCSSDEQVACRTDVGNHPLSPSFRALGSTQFLSFC